MMPITITVKPQRAVWEVDAPRPEGRRHESFEGNQRQAPSRTAQRRKSAVSRARLRKVGIAEIAAAADLTDRAFYTHFESKEVLCAEVIAHASGRSRAALESRLNWRASVEAYLSPKHVRDRAAARRAPARSKRSTRWRSGLTGIYW
jgi:AcrR family transcriptional regulator